LGEIEFYTLSKSDAGIPTTGTLCGLTYRKRKRKDWQRSM